MSSTALGVSSTTVGMTYARHMAKLMTTYQLFKPPDHAAWHKSSYKHMAEEEDKPAEKSFMGTDPLEPIHGPYRAGFKEKLKRLNA